MTELSQKQKEQLETYPRPCQNAVTHYMGCECHEARWKKQLSDSRDYALKLQDRITRTEHTLEAFRDLHPCIGVSKLHADGNCIHCSFAHALKILRGVR